VTRAPADRFAPVRRARACRVTTEGEAWTREQLERLLAARFRPAAVARFLAASQRRASAIRARRPEVARRELGWGAAGAAAWLVLAAARKEPFRRREVRPHFHTVRVLA
jgi:hypothetical protein